LDFEDQEGDWFQDRIRPFTSLIQYIIAYLVSCPVFMSTDIYEEHSESHLAIGTTRTQVEVMVVVGMMVARACLYFHCIPLPHLYWVIAGLLFLLFY